MPVIGVLESPDLSVIQTPDRGWNDTWVQCRRQAVLARGPRESIAVRSATDAAKDGVAGSTMSSQAKVTYPY